MGPNEVALKNLGLDEPFNLVWMYFLFWESQHSIPADGLYICKYLLTYITRCLDMLGGNLASLTSVSRNPIDVLNLAGNKRKPLDLSICSKSSAGMIYNYSLRIIGPSYRGVWICIAGLRDLQTPSFEIP